MEDHPATDIAYLRGKVYLSVQNFIWHSTAEKTSWKN